MSTAILYLAALVLAVLQGAFILVLCNGLLWAWSKLRGEP